MKKEIESIESILSRIPPGRYTAQEIKDVAGLEETAGDVGRMLMGERHLRKLKVVTEGPRKVFIVLPNVKVMAHPLAGANVDRGVRVEIRWKHRQQRG
jgi:hypothetical protein